MKILCPFCVTKSCVTQKGFSGGRSCQRKLTDEVSETFCNTSSTANAVPLPLLGKAIAKTRYAGRFLLIQYRSERAIKFLYSYCKIKAYVI